MSQEIIRLELRERAALAERSSGQPVSLAALWHELMSGQVRIADCFVAQRCYVVLRAPSPEEASAPLPTRQRQILEALLCGADNKTVAYDLDVAPSTVSQTARTALLLLGADCTPARACPLLAQAAQASCEGRDAQGRACAIVYEGQTYRVVGAARPDDALATLLTPAEYAVARCLLEGQHYVDIARHRGTSTRTVANQLAAVFRRMGVSGRSSLLRRLIVSEDLKLRSA